MTAGQGQDVRPGQVPGRESDRSIVAIRYGGRRIGLYRVKQVGEVGMLLNHGGISFPVGTRLDVEDFHHLLPNMGYHRLSATVVDNTASGIRLVWSHGKTGEIRWSP